MGKYHSHIQTEIDASYLYAVLAEHEKNPEIAEIFTEMSEIEAGHAQAFLKKSGETKLPSPSLRAKCIQFLGKYMGNDFILGILMETEKSLSY